MGVVDQAVQDAVGEGGVPNDIVPVVEGESAGAERGPPSVGVLKKLQEVVTLRIGESGEPEVVEDEELRLSPAGRGA